MSLNHRYIWSTRFVLGLLRAGRMSESASFSYFLAIMTFDWFQFTVIATTPTSSVSLSSSASSWATFVVTVLGLLYLYIKNGGGAGRQFLQRYFSLSVTVGWKFVLAVTVLLWLIPLTLANQSEVVEGWCTAFALAITNVIMFWRIGLHLGALSRVDA
jgi:hypothetical protein